MKNATNQNMEDVKIRGATYKNTLKRTTTKLAVLLKE
jgi:hypothetical protein